MRVEFTKRAKGSRVDCHWDAVRGKRTRVPGSTMGVGRGLPHDLAQYVIEAASGYQHGFWGLVAQGATFKSTGRKPTLPGRAVIAAHRHELAEAEKLAGFHMARWEAGERTPIAIALAAALAQWRALSKDERLVFTWPSAAGRVEGP